MVNSIKICQDKTFSVSRMTNSSTNGMGLSLPGVLLFLFLPDNDHHQQVDSPCQIIGCRYITRAN